MEGIIFLNYTIVRKYMKFLSLFFVILFFPVILLAQNNLPYVSQITAESRSNFIRLSWVDSPDARGDVFIFRSTRPFGDILPPNSKPIIVKYGTQSYIDDSDDIEVIYYFIAASDTAGRRYEMIIPNVNVVSINVLNPQVPERPIHRPELVMGISNLTARQVNNRITISWDIDGSPRNMILYRSMQQIQLPQDLKNAAIVQASMETSLTDSPVPGLPWYYAVIFEDEIALGNMGIRPGRNATTQAVMIPAAASGDAALRPLPLPVMTLQSVAGEGEIFINSPQRIPLSDDIMRFLDTSINQKMPLQLKKPRIFISDLESPASGEESAFIQIIHEYFIKSDWENTKIELQNYLSLPRSKEVDARARFYLGQAFYYSGNYRAALTEFLTVTSVYPIEANIWVSAVLDAMVY
jgi:hypothetical protein